MTKLVPTNANIITEIPERYTVSPEMDSIQAQKMLDVLNGIDTDYPMSKNEIINKLISSVPNTMQDESGNLVISQQIEDFLQAIDEKVKKSDKEKPQNVPQPQPQLKVKKRKNLINPQPYDII